MADGQPRYTTLRIEQEVAQRVYAYRDARDFQNASEAVRELLDIGTISIDLTHEPGENPHLPDGYAERMRGGD